MTTEVWARKAHPACWQLIDGHWRMTDLYHELWQMYLSGDVGYAKFLQRQRELEAAYDSEEPPF